METKGQLQDPTDVAETLRTPLAVINGALSILLKHGHRLDPSKQREWLEVAFDQVQDVNRAIGGALDLDLRASGEMPIVSLDDAR